ncbi:hypothetical protein J2X31_003605 [Flavobacterium arsenatis]|uniref:Uncharacterized protein n=1 Tax=Flavobacterium arsenatis TaxID=1484332 RepID=A0ABU1TUT9_9FLAO|nr:hypothetical protein [Flavobacterium arsenatis]MDR6969572.1 hypothetical protein [Flavobacterium arsenatis]
MRNNPFITVIFLICIEIASYIYIDYTDLIVPSSKYAGLIMPFFVFSIPVISIFISISIKDMAHKKAFQYFSIFLLVSSVILFIALTYLTALAKAYQH